MTNVNEALDAMQKGVDFLQSVKPVVSTIGGDAAVKFINAASAINGIAHHIEKRIEEGQIVATSENEAQLKSIVETIAKENDELSKIIAES